MVDLTGWPTGPYGEIIVDVPWRFVTRSDKGRGKDPAKHYKGGSMSLADIKGLPVGDLAADRCALAMWVYDPLLPQAIEVLDAWGFEFNSVLFVWLKRTTGGKLAFGQGYSTRKGSEQCWLAVPKKGRLPTRLNRGVRQVIEAPLREPSRKPDEQYERIELLYGPLARVELFGRQRWPGWDVWGDETDKFAPISSAGTVLLPPSVRDPAPTQGQGGCV
jgi:N6-adenosine-specific RNA methylase IME4